MHLLFSSFDEELELKEREQEEKDFEEFNAWIECEKNYIADNKHDYYDNSRIFANIKSNAEEEQRKKAKLGDGIEFFLKTRKAHFEKKYAK